MEVLSLCPLPAAPLLWQLQPSKWVLTVVCKATFRLEPGVSSLAPEQEPIFDEDNYLDFDPTRSVITPADLIPFKIQPEVVLVGSAHAPNGQPARSLVVRLNVGKVDKSMEVICPRVRTPEGDLREGKRWTRMPLSWEKSAGGPDTENPVGVGPKGPRDPYGQLPLPNLQPPGFSVANESLPPIIGFGPLSAAWPLRRNKLGRNHFDRDFARAPFGDGFDPIFFQVAPLDQRLESLRNDERIILTNLHPKHALLTTALPGTKPRARIELSGAATREIALLPDTLWIDTDRAICTVTYRGKVDVEHPEQQGRVLIATATSDQPIQWSKIAPPPPAPSVPAPPNVAAPSVAVPPNAAAPNVTAPPNVAVPPNVAAPIKSPTAKPGSIVMPSPSVPPPPIVAPRVPPAPPSTTGKRPPDNLPPLRRSEARDVRPLVPSTGGGAGPNRPITRPRPEGGKPKPLPVPLSITPVPIDDEPSNDGDFDVEITMSEAPGRTLDRTGPLAAFGSHNVASGNEDRALPFQPAQLGSRSIAGGGSAPLPAPPPPPSSPGIPPVFGLPPMEPHPNVARTSSLDWVDTGALPALDPKTADIPAPGVPPPALISSPSPQAPHSWANMAGALMPPPPPPPQPMPLPIAPPAMLPAPPADGAFGLLEASNAAAARHDISPKGDLRNQPAVEGRVEGEARPNLAPADALTIELIWFDLLASPLLSRNATFAKFKRPVIEKAPNLDKSPNEKGPSEGAPEKNGTEAPSLEGLLRTHVYEVLSRGASINTNSLDAVLDLAEEESPPAPALTLVSGVLELCLDEIEMLKATVLAATPLASSDKKLKETIDVATEALKSPMLGMPDFAQGLSMRVKDAWGKANRLLPPDHLAVCTERLLLEQRSYQKRDLLDDTWIRALLLSPGSDTAVPTYLPARIAKRLPLYKRFSARILGEVVWQQDQYETYPLAIRALALGRLPQRPRSRGRPRGAPL